MFRSMRRKARQLSAAESEQIIRDASSGVLAVYGDDGYPYAVPVSHVYTDGKIVFHCAREGHKIDSIRRNEKVSFCVIAFGRARIVEDEAGLRRIAGLIGEKFSHDYPEDCLKETDEVIAHNRMYCVEIEVDHITGKCAKEVMVERKRRQHMNMGVLQHR